MKTLLPSLLIASCVVTISSTASARPAQRVAEALAERTPQPEMNEAIVQLEEARRASRPIEHLEKAKHHLEDARHNKHGERAEALKQIHEAIEAARHDNRKAMETHIAAALHEVREGKQEARR